MSKKKKDRRKWWRPPGPAPKKEPKDEFKAALEKLREAVKAYYG